MSDAPPEGVTVATITVGDLVFEDGYQSAICIREKVKRTFWGACRLTEQGRVVAEGPCPVDGTIMTRILYVPPV